MRNKNIEAILAEINDERLKSCVLAAIKAGKAIQRIGAASASNIKRDSPVGHHSVVTSADLKPQGIILEDLGRSYPDTWFIAEEQADYPKILTPDTYVDRLDGQVFGVDPLDGSSGHFRGLYEWSTSIGLMQRLEHELGVIYAPRVLDGALVFGRRDHGVYLVEGNKKPRLVKIAPDRSVEETLVYFGCDTPFIPEFLPFLHDVSRRNRTSNIAGSCALGLAMVACGRIDALIQPPQGPWDWFGGYPLVEEAGGVVQFYRIDGGKILPVAKPLPTDYNPAIRALGFIAGNKTLVGQLMTDLRNQFGTSSS